MNQSAESSNDGQSRVGLNVLLFAVDCFATTIEVFLRHGFGERYLGGRAAVGLFVPLLFSLFLPPIDPTPLLGIMWSYVFVVCIARVAALRRRWRGITVHRYYGGEPWLMKCRWFERMSEDWVKRLVEPIVCILVSLCLMIPVTALGLYLFVGGLCLAIKSHVSIALVDLRARAMQDALIEQELMAERFRELQR